MAATLPLATKLAARLEAERHRVLEAHTAGDVTRWLDSMCSGKSRPADLMVVDAALLTRRAADALRDLRTRDRPMLLVVIAGAADRAGRELAATLGAAVVADPPEEGEAGFIAECAALGAPRKDD